MSSVFGWKLCLCLITIFKRYVLSPDHALFRIASLCIFLSSLFPYHSSFSEPVLSHNCSPSHFSPAHTLTLTTLPLLSHPVTPSFTLSHLPYSFFTLSHLCYPFLHNLSLRCSYFLTTLTYLNFSLAHYSLLTLLFFSNKFSLSSPLTDSRPILPSIFLSVILSLLISLSFSLFLALTHVQGCKIRSDRKQSDG